MSASLCIQIYSIPKTDKFKEEIKFYENEYWNEKTEEELINGLQTSLKRLRTLGIKLHLDVIVEVRDIDKANRLLANSGKIKQKPKKSKLTLRELEVLNLVMDGMTTKEIGEKLFISSETVKSHRKHILEKTGAKNAASLINYYHQTFFDK